MAPEVVHKHFRDLSTLEDSLRVEVPDEKVVSGDHLARGNSICVTTLRLQAAVVDGAVTDKKLVRDIKRLSMKAMNFGYMEEGKTNQREADSVYETLRKVVNYLREKIAPPDYAI